VGEVSSTRDAAPPSATSPDRPVWYRLPSITVVALLGFIAFFYSVGNSAADTGSGVGKNQDPDTG